MTIVREGGVQADVQDSCRRKHRHLIKQLLDETGWEKETELAVGNEAIAESHDKRTILELVQNARDAVRRGSRPSTRERGSTRKGEVAVIVGPESLYIANTGEPFRLNDEDVFKAVTGLKRSAKVADREAIGEKGVGMKSLLQAGEKFGIHSVVDGERIAAEFSRMTPSEGIVSEYQALLENEQYRQRAIDAHGPDRVEQCRTVLNRLIKNTSLDSNTDQGHEVIGNISVVGEGVEPPDPVDVITELPRLSLFKYPTIDSSGSNSGPNRRLIDLLLESDESFENIAADMRFDEDLKSRIQEHAGQYSTVVRLDYTDERWRAFLDGIEEAFAETGFDETFTEAIERFEREREPDEQSIADQDRVWEECRSLGLETLVLLGELGVVEFLRIEQDEKQLVLREAERYKVDVGDTTIVGEADNSSEVERRPITIEKHSIEPNYDESSTVTLREYTRSLKDFNTDDDGLTEPMRLLYELPEPERDDWQPKPNPLHLFYPIEEEGTPFPFVAHAPFRVSMDRQSLVDNDYNEKLLNRLVDFVTTTAEDLTKPGSEFEKWVPWLVTPLAVADENQLNSNENRLIDVEDLVKATCAGLRESEIVPTNWGVSRPDQVLFEPNQPKAFEPLRKYGQGKRPLPAKEVIESSSDWFKRADARGSLDSDSRREATGRIGLTAVVDRPFHSEENQPGLLSTLRDVWGATNSEPGNVAVEVNTPEIAEQYFTTIVEAIERYEENETESHPDVGMPRTSLGRWGIPLLPAEAHTGTENTDTTVGDVKYLVRAIDRGAAPESIPVDERIVFRRKKPTDTTRTTVDHAPPESLDIFVVPFREEWSGQLEANNRKWGTQLLDSTGAFYQRVAAEVGGLSVTASDTVLANQSGIGYVFYLFRTVAASQNSDWLAPVPYQGWQFTTDDDTRGVEDVLKGNKLWNRPDDDDYLQRRFARCTPVPLAGGGTAPAENVVFGQMWADQFRSAAATIQENYEGEEEPFADAGPTETKSRTVDLRRWAEVIEVSAKLREEDTPIVAPPGDERWQPILTEAFDQDDGGSAKESPANVTELGDEERRWVVDFLLHLGVQVGPHIQWSWLFPKAATKKGHRRTGALTRDEVTGLLSEQSDIVANRFTPTPEGVNRYNAVCWRAEHHPAFTASHTSGCRNNLLDAPADKWSHIEGHYLAVPTWWRFTEYAERKDRSFIEAFRQAVLLLWPELDDRLFWTGWVCSDNSTGQPHNISRPRQLIPSFGLVQLRQMELWPTEWPTSGPLNTDSPSEPYQPKMNPAHMLVFDPDSGGGGVEQYLPCLEIDSLDTISISTESATDEHTQSVLPNARDIAAVLGIQPVNDLAPAGAAERLDVFLSACAELNRSPDTERGESIRYDARTVRRPVFGLLRRLLGREHLREYLPDQEAKQQRDWQRRAIWHTGTQLIVNVEGRFVPKRLGSEITLDDVDIYTERPPPYARTILAERGDAYLLIPSDRLGSIARILGDRDSDSITFGLRRRTEGDLPEPPVAEQEEIANAVDQDVLQEIETHAEERLEYLVAAYDQHHGGDKELEEIYQALQTVLSRGIGVVPTPEDVHNRPSVKWNPPEDNAGPSIALVAAVLNDHSGDTLPPHYLADGLAQIIEDRPSQALRRDFENVLMKDTDRLEMEYETTLESLQRSLTDLVERRVNALEEALTQIVAVLTNKDESQLTFGPANDLEMTEAESAFATLDGATGSDDKTLRSDSVVESWTAWLVAETSLSARPARGCLLAAANRTQNVERCERYLLEALDEADELGTISQLATKSAWSDLSEWQSRSVRSLREIRTYLIAVAQIEYLVDELQVLEDPSESELSRAAYEAKTATVPAPTQSVHEALPCGDSLSDQLRNIPVVAIADTYSNVVGDWSPTTNEGISSEVEVHPDVCNNLQEWWEKNVSMLIAHDRTVFSEVRKYEDRITEALATPSVAGDIVEDALDNLAGRQSIESPSSNTRGNITRDWIERDTPESVELGREAVNESVPSDGGSAPTVGDRQHNPTVNPDAEVPRERGRIGEIICLDRSWSAFQATPPEIRTRILEQLRAWREWDQWRMQRPDDTISDLAGITEFDDAKAVLTSTLDGTEASEHTAREIFLNLFDVSEERGPGFDYVDPFGTHYGKEWDEWQENWMQRVEVKAVLPTSSGRFKLTGNEFRMARRRGPDCDKEGYSFTMDGVDRYLVRVVELPRTEDVNDSSPEPKLWDIEDVVTYGHFDESEPVWERLRGGEFPVNFEL